jgi:hypothetical protein
MNRRVTWCLAGSCNRRAMGRLAGACNRRVTWCLAGSCNRRAMGRLADHVETVLSIREKRRILPWNRPAAPFTLVAVEADRRRGRRPPSWARTSTPMRRGPSTCRGGPSTTAQPSTTKVAFVQLTALVTVCCATVAAAARQYGILPR